MEGIGSPRLFLAFLCHLHNDQEYCAYKALIAQHIQDLMLIVLQYESILLVKYGRGLLNSDGTHI